MDGGAGQAGGLAPAFLLVGEEQRGEGGREEEREDTEGREHAVRDYALDEEDQEGGGESRDGDGAEGVRRRFCEDGEVEKGAGHGGFGAGDGDGCHEVGGSRYRYGGYARWRDLEVQKG